ncbi:MAG: threonylcarbamoyl-AMP synthase [Verrucomicrobia bacterium]|nr:threonylcarbamoyl-AMP synthase [Verrucomicrobiota bacterium]
MRRRRAIILPTRTEAERRHAIETAAEALRAGELVATPTETVYGLAANALGERAVRRICEAKGRPPNNPLIVHVDGTEMARRWAAVWPETAQRLAEAFWPGPLTLVLPKAAGIPDAVTGGGGTVGLRHPQAPLTEAIIRRCGFPLAAPSANRSSEISPTTADHVARSLGDRIRWIVDGGPCPVGIESTVLDLSVQPPRVLRPGMIGPAALAAALGQTPRAAGGPEERGRGPLRSPGLLDRHYAPRAALLVWRWREESELLERLEAAGLSPDRCALAALRLPRSIRFRRTALMPRGVAEYGRALYRTLHECDAPGIRAILVEAPPERDEWEAIWDRLRRAAAR